MEKKSETDVKTAEVVSDTPETENPKAEQENIETPETECQNPEECLTAENEALLAENEALSKENQELTAAVQRLQAEFENYRRRTIKEKEELSQIAIGNLLACLFPVLDNFERALTHGSDKGLLEGMQMVYNQLVGILTEAGLQPLGAVGEAFDPKVHDAFLQEESDEAESNSILEVLQKGYAMGDRLLRPAMVKVAK